jgi:hypothetical protein
MIDSNTPHTPSYDMDRKEYPNKPLGRRISTRAEGVVTLLRGIFNREGASSMTIHTNKKHNNAPC